MPDGKPAGVRCVQLSEDNRCLLFGKPERPAVCGDLKANEEMCGSTFDDAYRYITRLEAETRPE